MTCLEWFGEYLLRQVPGSRFYKDNLFLLLYKCIDSADIIFFECGKEPFQVCGWKAEKSCKLMKNNDVVKS